MKMYSGGEEEEEEEEGEEGRWQVLARFLPAGHFHFWLGADTADPSRRSSALCM